jgi:threonine/homoserine/homoserine lactone efflux protein
MHMSALAFQVIKYTGTVYLLYLAWSMWRETGALTLKRPPQCISLLNIAVRGILINILNPKLSMFFWAFLPLFISQNTMSPLQQMAILSAVFMLMTLVIFILYGVLASAVSLYLTSSPNAVRRLQRSFAAIFAVLAAKLALSDQ